MPLLGLWVLFPDSLEVQHGSHMFPGLRFPMARESLPIYEFSHAGIFKHQPLLSAAPTPSPSEPQATRFPSTWHCHRPMPAPFASEAHSTLIVTPTIQPPARLWLLCHGRQRSGAAGRCPACRFWGRKSRGRSQKRRGGGIRKQNSWLSVAASPSLPGSGL